MIKPSLQQRINTSTMIIPVAPLASFCWFSSFSRSFSRNSCSSETFSRINICQTAREQDHCSSLTLSKVTSTETYWQPSMTTKMDTLLRWHAIHDTRVEITNLSSVDSSRCSCQADNNRQSFIPFIRFINDNPCPWLPRQCPDSITVSTYRHTEYFFNATWLHWVLQYDSQCNTTVWCMCGHKPSTQHCNLMP